MHTSSEFPFDLRTASASLREERNEMFKMTQIKIYRFYILFVFFFFREKFNNSQNDGDL